MPLWSGDTNVGGDNDLTLLGFDARYSHVRAYHVSTVDDSNFHHLPCATECRYVN